MLSLNQVLLSFWGVNQISTTIGSRDMVFVTFFALRGLFSSYFWLTTHDPKNSTCFFLTLLESQNQFLKEKWIYMEVHTGGNSAPRVYWLIIRLNNWYRWLVILVVCTNTSTFFTWRMIRVHHINGNVEITLAKY